MEIEMEKMEEEVEMGEVMAKATGWCWNRNGKSPANLREKASKISGEGAACLYTPEPPTIRQPELGAEAAIDGQPTHSLPLTI
jgi:hypothetical protein